MIRISKKLSAEQNCASVGWYVLATKSGEEQRAKLHLERQGYRIFLPQLNLKKKRKGKWEVITESLFPGYLFISLELGKDDPAPIRSTAGCIGLVRFGHTYPPVPPKLIAALKAAAAADDPALSPFQSGDVVRLISGPFAGLEAVYDKARGEERAQVLLEVLGMVQRLTVELDTLNR